VNESFGGTYMIYIFIVFVALYIVFISLVMNYVRAFKVKNQIINYIEQYEEYEPAKEAIDEYARNLNFINSTDEELYVPGKTCVTEYRYCYQKHIVRQDDDLRVYYTVEVYVPWNFPLLGLEGNNWVIKGETRMLNKLA